MRATAILALFLSLVSAQGFAQGIVIKDTILTTFPYSDPDPVPRESKIFPYYRYDTFSLDSSPQTWKIVMLENDYLRVTILPEIGGKIWSVIDKKTGEDLFYNNDVVKFRDISLRGPWTSGGIEFNYGIIGHAPSCAFPVDYSTQSFPDGSVSCYIGALDLLTRTRWTMEIHLPKNEGWLRTRSFWHNSTGDYQPYYHWANSAVNASEDLMIVYPSAYSISHKGTIESFPVDSAGRDLSIWKNQNFGADKSFHPAGFHCPFFSSYWAEKDFGMVHFCQRDEKLGRKFFTWALSDQGEIWKELLTEKKGQYVELQSGRLFNQNFPDDMDTPFRQVLFHPFGTEVWEEYWAPYSDIGVLQDANTRGVSQLESDASMVTFRHYPFCNASGTLSFQDDNGNVIETQSVSFQTAIPFFTSLHVTGEKVSKVLFNGVTLLNLEDQILDRPTVLPDGYSLDSVGELVLRARLAIGTRNYRKAEAFADLALAKDPFHIEALTIKAMTLLQKADAEGAYLFANRALAINEYDPQANYVCGEAALLLRKKMDAKDRFEVAALSSEIRSAALTKLSQIYYQEGEKELSCAYADKSLIGNAYNLSAYMMKYLCSRDEHILEQIAALDPLCPFPAFAQFLSGQISSDHLASTFHSEFPWQDYLETAVFLSNVGLKEDAIRILDACHETNALVRIWVAWLNNDISSISDAETGSLNGVFPFRVESVRPLLWAVENSGTWKSRYLLSVLLNHLGDPVKALDYIKDVHDVPFAPFYAFRASLESNRIDDLQQAIQLDPEQWRYIDLLTRDLLSIGRVKEARSLIEPYYKKHPTNSHTTDTYVKALLKDGAFKTADKVLSTIQILPYEGQQDSHELYRNIKLHRAAEALDRGRVKEALSFIEESRQWPHNLGVGKPYDDLIDNRYEDFFTAVALERKGNLSQARVYLSRIPDPDNSWNKLFVEASNPQFSIVSYLQGVNMAPFIVKD